MIPDNEQALQSTAGSLSRTRVVFVGAFEASGTDGTVGGITYACRTLLQSSQAQHVDWVLIDSTATTNKARSMLSRLPFAARRIATFTRAVAGGKEGKPDKALIFSAHGVSFLEKGLMALIAGWCRVPVVFAPTSGFLADELQGRPWQARFARLMFKRCESIVCQSMFWKQFYRDYCDNEQALQVVQNWIDVQSYPTGTAVQKFPVTTVLFMAWLVREKGIFELLEAVARIRREQSQSRQTPPPFEVIICGDGDDLAAARRIVESQVLSNVSFRGWVTGNDKADLLLRSHVFVTPSYAEGLSNSLLEAMASSLAVISTDVGAAVDVVDDGVNGFLVPVRDSVLLSERLQRLLNDAQLRQQVGAQARKSVVENNALEIGVPRFMALLERRAAPTEPRS